MSITVKTCTVDTMENDRCFTALINGYAEESVIPELGKANPQLGMYRKLESAGVLTVIAAYREEILQGFIAFVVLPSPHQGATIATVQSFYVHPEYRKQGAGLKLLREAERIAKEKGAIGVFVSAPLGGKLASVLPRKGYRPTNLSFFKGIA